MTKRIEQLARLAFDASAGPGEAENAAVMLVREARRQGLTYADLFAPATPARQLPAAARIRLNFGKHAGECLGAIAEHDPGYLDWLLNNATRLDRTVRQAVRVTLDFYTTEAA